jgi:hypothetical protein
VAALETEIPPDLHADASAFIPEVEGNDLFRTMCHCASPLASGERLAARGNPLEISDFFFRTPLAVSFSSPAH